MPRRWHVFTDGAWDGEQQQEDDQNDRGAPPPAGYGAVEITCEPRPMDGSDEDEADGSVHTSRPHCPIGQLTSDGGADDPHAGHLTWLVSGQVEEDPAGPTYIGAAAQTNNTGELSALYYALKRAEGRRPGVGRETIHSDSLYAINMTTGKWMPRAKGRRNADMIAGMRRLWRRVQRRRPGEVSLRHVRSHVKVPGNEIADWLAGCGAEGMRRTIEDANEWLRRWLRRHSSPGPPHGENGRSPGHRPAGARPPPGDG